MTRLALVLGLATVAAACAQTPTLSAAPEATVSLFKSLGGRQCESAGQSAEDASASLRAARIQLLGLQCGHDGRMRAQVCGASDGRIVIVDVPASQTEAAQALGFAPLSLRPDAVRAPCR